MARILTIAVLIAILIAILFATLASGPRHDYVEYLEAWRSVVAGAVPWGPGMPNAYGPLFNPLGFLVPLHPLLPKLLFALAWILAAAWILSGAGDRRAPASPPPRGRVRRILVPGAIAAAGWCVLAFFVVPRLVLAAHAGRGPGFLRALMEGRGEHSAEVYLDACRNVAFAGLTAIVSVVLVAAALTGRRWNPFLASDRGVADRGTVDHAPLIIFLLLNPLLWFTIAYAGTFDILPACACLAAVRLRRRGRDAWSGVLCGVAVLLKYYPLALLPFLALSRGRLRPRVLLAGAATIAGGLLAAFLVWGGAVFHPLLFAADRGPKALSVFRFLEGDLSPLRLLGTTFRASSLSLPLMVAAIAAAWVWAFRQKVGLERSAFVGMLAALTFYKVGNQQFLAVLVLLAADWVVSREGLARAGPRLRGALGLYFGFLAGNALFGMASMAASGNRYMFFGFPWSYWGELVGLPAFCASAWLLAACSAPRADGGSSGSDPRDLRRQGQSVRHRLAGR